MRVYKDEKEIEDLRISCRANKKAFEYVMTHLKPGMKEY